MTKIAHNKAEKAIYDDLYLLTQMWICSTIIAQTKSILITKLYEKSTGMKLDYSDVRIKRKMFRIIKKRKDTNKNYFIKIKFRFFELSTIKFTKATDYLGKFRAINNL